MSTPQQNSEAAIQRDSNGPVFVIGGGVVGQDVADRLTASGETVTFVDQSPPTDPPPGQRFHGVGTDVGETLADLDIGDDATVLVLGPDDAPNLLIAQHLRTKFDVEHLAVRVNDPDRVDVFENVDVEVIDATAVLGRAIIQRW